MKRTALFAAAAAAVIVAAPATAHADSGLSVDPAGDPLFDVTNIFPGWSQSRDVTIGNHTDAAASITVEATDIADLENGCNHPESFADQTCGPDDGELADQLLIAVHIDADGDGQVESEPTWSGTLRNLVQPVSIDADLAAGSTTAMRVDATLPFSSGNETQTDQVAFALRFTLAGETVVVQGARHTRTPDRSVLGTVVDHLPLTGTPTSRLVASAGWTAGAGILLVLLARRRRPRETD